MTSLKWAAGFVALTLVGTACPTPPPPGLTCGAGTHEQEGACVADAPAVLVQTGQPVPAPAPQPCAASTWCNDLSVKLGVTLTKQYDSSGPDAWDPVLHPLVFITPVGPGYGGKLSGVKWPGVTVIDANSREIVKYAAYDMSAEGWSDANVFESHGMAVSLDGKWIYLPTGSGTARGFMVINARTLKLDKFLQTDGRPHHAKAFTDSAGKSRVLLYGWEQPPFVLDPLDNNKVVGGADMNATGMEGYLWFVDPTGKELWGSGRWRNGNVRAEVHGNQVMIVDTTTWKLKSTIPWEGESTPVWVDFTPDNKYAYVSGGHSSTVLKYDRAAKKVLGISRAGVEGPYGLRLNWDGKEIYAIGKGEGSTNLGQDIGLLDTKRIELSLSATANYTTGCVRGDHITLHPDPAKNELWLSCNSSFEVAIFDMTTKAVSARIPMPSSGSTHSGAFVSYKSDWSGDVLSDQNGLHGPAFATQLSKWAP
ncbi:MAG: hypothetical protein HYZ28_05190 [Myxococcales bacterium]|nr:hypothetical protein [Myxococcales bacterium]